MFKDIATIGESTWASTLGVLPDDLKIPKEGSGEI